MEAFQGFLQSLRYDQIAYAGIITFIVYRILTGGLYSKRAVDEIRSERDDWKTAYLTEQKTNIALVEQNGELTELARTADHVIRSLPRPGGANENP